MTGAADGRPGGTDAAAGDAAAAPFEERLRRAQELNALSRVRPASTEFRRLLADLDRLERSGAHPSWLPELRLRALIGQASCAHALTGDLEAGMRELAAAERYASGVGSARLCALVHGQRGLLLLRAGDSQAAIRPLGRALAGSDPGNRRDLAVLSLNRGSALVDVGEHAAALADYEAALEHARALGNDYYASFALHNIGYVRYLLGDIPAALRDMDRSVELLPDGPDGFALVGRARVLYEAGLLTEAERTLDAAEPLLAEEGLGLERADAALDRARCLAGLRRYDEAVRVARTAQRLYRRAGNPTWELSARVVRLEALLGQDRGRPRAARRWAARRCAQALAVAAEADARGAVAAAGVAVPARLMAAEWSLLAGDVDGAARVLARVPRNLRRAALPVRLHHQAVRAELAFACGERGAGLRAVRRGQRILVEHRERLGSVDTVTAAAAHGVRIGNVDVAAALRTRRPDAVFDAVERGRATVAGGARVRPPADDVAAGLLTRARQELEAARAAAADASPDVAARQAHVREARRLQEDARRRRWHDGEGAGAPVPTTARALGAALRERAPGTVVANFVLHVDDVLAVRVHAHGQRLVRLASRRDVAERVRRARADLVVVANDLVPATVRDVAGASLARSLAWLDDVLLGPLDAAGDVPLSARDLHVAARDLLLAVPWSALPSRRGVRTWVNSWVDLRPGAVQRRAGDVVVVAGPDLRASVREAELVASVWGDATLLTGAAATCGATVRHLGGAGVVHLAAHGSHENDNPLFSSLRLADGPVFAHELDGIDLRGAVVVLSACEVGLSTSRVGGEPIGLASVLLRLGARAVIAAVAPLQDEVAARVMPNLHAALRDGAMPGEALGRAVAQEPGHVPLVCFGPLVV